jgi:DNA-binding NtrC family response regulator
MVRIEPSVTSKPAANSQRLQDIERNHVLQMMEQQHWNKVHAAKALGISRRALYRLLEKYGLTQTTESSVPQVAETPATS